MPGAAIMNFLTGGIADKAMGVLGKFVRDKDLGAKLDNEQDLAAMKAELTLALQSMNLEESMLEVAKTQIESVNAVNLADAKSDDPLQRRWRPIVCLMLGFAVINHYAFAGYLQWALTLYNPDAPPLPVIEDVRPLVYLLGGVLGIYMPARTIEKLASRPKAPLGLFAGKRS